MKLVGVLEGLLFVVGDDGITLNDISETLKISKDEAKELLIALKKEYEQDNRGIRISFLGNAFKLTTKKEYKEYYENLVKVKEDNLTQSQLEVLAIIAYNEPITRIEIDDIRGSNSTYIIRKLLSKDLIKVTGHSDMPGKPNLYRTTREFLDLFGLATLNDLPEMININEDDEEENLFKKKDGIELL